MNFNGQTRLINDNDEKNAKVAAQMKYGNYFVDNMAPINILKRDYEALLGNEVGFCADKPVRVEVKEQFTNFEVEHNLRNGKMGNQMTNFGDKTSKLLETRQFTTLPYIGAGSAGGMGMNPDVDSELRYGELSLERKSVSDLSGIFINRYTPLVPCLRDNIQNVNHIVPRYWVNGGMSTRGVVKNIDYLRECGLKK